ncbi:MAG TPA: hypothetical protein VHM91_10790 [Verrucomicrobiales bacterium]|nr:hypothetical protein [Verrucomicrobiales bacterium]
MEDQSAFANVRSTPGPSRALLWALRGMMAALPVQAVTAQQAVISSARLAEQNRFVVESDVPAGAGYASLEVLAPAKSAAWKTMIAGAVDGRAAHVTFSLPRPEGAPTVLARVRTGIGQTVPVAELTDPSLMTVTYSAGGVSEETKIALLNAAGAKMREWSALPRTQRQASLIAWAKSNAGVADAYVSPIADNVCIEFNDGDISILLNRQRTDGSTPPNLIPQGMPAAQSMGVAAAAVQGVSGSADFGLPENNTAVTAYSLEAAVFPNSAPTIGGWLTAAHYSTRTFGSTTVDEIKSWSSEGNPLGVLFWQAHGCSYGKAHGLEGIAIVTRQGVTEELSKGAYKSMRESGELLMAKDDNETQPLYTVTSKFVKKYMHFAPHSVVILDTCYAAHLEIAGAFITAGAGAYAAWDGESGIKSTTPILKVFDRLTGSNQEPPVSIPPERPFTLPVIRMWMQMFNYDIDPSPKYPDQIVSNPKLTWQTHPTTPAYILKPSVMRVLYEYASQGEPFTKFLIEGNFGNDPGPSKRKVFWGGQEVNVLRWEEDYGIVIKPPASPPAGDFKVVIRNVYESNASPFSEWTVPFTYEFNGQGSLHFKVEMNVKIRADIHGSRGMPEMPVQYLTVPFSNLDDSTGQVSASGTYSPDRDTVIGWSGGTALHSVDPEASGGGALANLIHNGGAFNLLNGNIENFALQDTGSFVETVNGDAHDLMSPVVGFEWPRPVPKLNLGSNKIMGDTLTFTAPDGTGSAKLSWPTVTPVAGPTLQTPR